MLSYAPRPVRPYARGRYSERYEWAARKTNVDDVHFIESQLNLELVGERSVTPINRLTDRGLTDFLITKTPRGLCLRRRIQKGL